MATTTATGSRDVPQPPALVWRALAVLEPYCSVCDVSYVLGDGPGSPGLGTTFVCTPGRLDGAPGAGGPPGERARGGPAGAGRPPPPAHPGDVEHADRARRLGGRRHPGDDDDQPRADGRQPRRPAAPGPGAAEAGAADRGGRAREGARAHRTRFRRCVTRVTLDHDRGNGASAPVMGVSTSIVYRLRASRHRVGRAVAPDGRRRTLCRSSASSWSASSSVRSPG